MTTSTSSSGFFDQRLPQPVNLLAMHDAWPTRYPFLLESADGDAPNARYDLLFYSEGEHLSLQGAGEVTGNHPEFNPSDRFLDALTHWQSRCPQIDQESELPFLGGWFLYLGYELAEEIEPSLQLPEAPGQLPRALAVRCPAAIVHDRLHGDWHIVGESTAILEQISSDIAELTEKTFSVSEISVETLHENDAESFTGAVEQIKEYILAGDVFQVNLSRLWTGRLPAAINDADIYAQLRMANPAPFAGLLHWNETTLFSSSPERLVELRGNKVQTRPIAGTRPRSRVDEADEFERNALVAHPKERAEHIMLIDLERNDLGRVCVPGSVEVDELMVLESYAHVHHIVSNVRGLLLEGASASDVIRAVFPGGTITGCPKVRCMEIIAELEGEGRSYYTGAMGYLDRRGNMDLNILIRCIEREAEQIRFRTGAGIVADSVPDNELQETRAKARGLLRALNAE